MEDISCVAVMMNRVLALLSILWRHNIYVAECLQTRAELVRADSKLVADMAFLAEVLQMYGAELIFLCEPGGADHL